MAEKMSRITDLKRNFDLNKKLVRFIRVFEIQALQKKKNSLKQRPGEKNKINK